MPPRTDTLKESERILTALAFGKTTLAHLPYQVLLGLTLWAVWYRNGPLEPYRGQLSSAWSFYGANTSQSDNTIEFTQKSLLA